MRPTALIDGALDEHRAALAHLRQTEHWRRLVAARLDLAVAAVTDIDDPGVNLASISTQSLRSLLGVPDHAADADALLLSESARLVGLRQALTELDARLALARRESEEAVLRVAEALGCTPAEVWTKPRIPD